MKQKQINIGAAIIVKNGEATLERMLRSIFPFCWQIVIVDTGSTDKTTSICTRYGAEIHYFQWVDDFSAARNHSLGLMRTDWILIIDADEELDRESFSKNLFLLENDITQGINTILQNKVDNGNALSNHRFTRIIRNNPNFRFEGKIHEQIRPSIEKAGGLIIESDIIIHHFGYAAPNPEKFKRNRDFLEKELSEKPADGWLKYHLAETDFAMGSLDKARSYFEEAIASGELSIEQVEKSRIKLAQIALSKDEINILFENLNFICNDSDREGFRLYLMAAGYLVLRDFEAAYKLYSSDLLYKSAMVDKEKVTEARDALKRVLNK